MNWAATYLWENGSQPNAWRDNFATVRGPAVADFLHIFRQQWSMAGGDSTSVGQAYSSLESRRPDELGSATVALMQSTPGQGFATNLRVLCDLLRTAQGEVFIEHPYL